MAVLEKMRKRMGFLITTVIALAMLAFILDADTLQSTLSMFSSKYDVGKIGKKSITQQEFSKRVDYYNNIYQITNGATSSEESTEMINNSAWQSFLTDEVIMPACENAGISVGDKEQADMIQGADISPVIQREQAFLNENGVYDKNLFMEFYNNIERDNSGAFRNYWNFLQTNMIQDRMFSKYANMLAKSSIVNNLQAKRDISENNTSYSIDFVIKPVALAADTTVTVSDAEINSFYERIRPALKQQESRDMEYIVFDILPSERDFEDTKKQFEKSYDEFASTANDGMRAFLARNSDTKYSEIYFKKGDLNNFSSTLDEFVATHPAGALMEPQPNENTFIAAKVLDVAMRPDSVFVKFIPTSGEAQADSVMRVLASSPNSFSKIAAEFAPAQPGIEPGTIGWITELSAPNMLPAEFTKVFTMRKGENTKLKIGDNFYIARADQMTTPVRKAKVAILSAEVAPSQQTYSQIYAQANSAADFSGGNINRFEQYVNENKLELRRAQKIFSNDKTFGGYDKVREIVRWLFDAKLGEVSNVVSIENKYFFVSALKGISPAGYASVKELSESIKNYLVMQKRVDKLADECKSKISGATTIEDIAGRLETTVSSQNDVTFASLASAGSQLDPKFIGAVSMAGQKGESGVVGPVKGSLGVYYFQIKDKQVGSFYSETDAQRKNDYNVYQLMNSLTGILTSDAKIEDKRYKFY